MQILVNGVINGLAIALVALAFACAYLPTRVFHIALAGVYVVAPFAAWQAVRLGVPVVLAAVGAALVAALLSGACEVINHWPLHGKGASSGAHLISSLGIYMVVVQIVVMVWGSQSKVLRSGLDSSHRFGGIALSGAQIVVATVATVGLLGFGLWLRRSNVGLQLRALADNPVELALRGFNVRRIRCIAFLLAGLLASSASLAVAYDVGFDAQVGMSILLQAVVAVIVGGERSFAGAVLGGVLLGIIRTEATWFLSSRWQDACTFAILALFLAVRPQGIVAAPATLEAQP